MSKLVIKLNEESLKRFINENYHSFDNIMKLNGENFLTLEKLRYELVNSGVHLKDYVEVKRPDNLPVSIDYWPIIYSNPINHPYGEVEVGKVELQIW